MNKSEQYIADQLRGLKEKSAGPNEGLIGFLFKTVMSKKFRKYSVNLEYQAHIHSAIDLNFKNGEPIKVAMVFGGYKLWRFEEAPEPDWAELFSIIYYAHWLKPIADHYKPGVWFDFYSDDVIVKYIDNIPKEDTNKYSETFQGLLDFTRKYLPNNFKITFNRVGDQYKSEKDFLTDVEIQKKKLLEKYGGKLPKLTEEQKDTLSLNVRLTEEQKETPKWEEIQLLHDAYMLVERRRPYYRTPDKIVAITKKLDNTIAVGTTKTSIAKFWAGVGALKRTKDDGFIETILTPNQLSSVNPEWETIEINGLKGKNFQRIRIVS